MVKNSDYVTAGDFTSDVRPSDGDSIIKVNAFIATDELPTLVKAAAVALDKYLKMGGHTRGITITNTDGTESAYDALIRENGGTSF